MYRPAGEHNNLCDDRRVPGAIARIGKSTMVITTWYAEHAGEHGLILLNDFAFGDLFGGRVGFETKLAQQGFVNVRLLRTPAELETAKIPKLGNEAGNWSGPWLGRYPWESGADEEDDNTERLE
jgi:hypothetical protein